MSSDERFIDENFETRLPIPPSSRTLRSSSISLESNLISTDVYPKSRSLATIEKGAVTQNSKFSRSFQKIRSSVER